jgi:hypothetical protein
MIVYLYEFSGLFGSKLDLTDEEDKFAKLGG